MSYTIKEIVDLILSFIKQIIRDLKLKKAEEALQTQEKKTDELVEKTTFDYDTFQRDLLQYERERAANVRPATEEVRSDSNTTTRNDKKPRQRAPVATRTNKRAKKRNQRNRKRK
jgi:hypothetical protein